MQPELVSDGDKPPPTMGISKKSFSGPFLERKSELDTAAVFTRAIGIVVEISAEFCCSPTSSSHAPQ